MNLNIAVHLLLALSLPVMIAIEYFIIMRPDDHRKTTRAIYYAILIALFWVMVFMSYIANR